TKYYLDKFLINLYILTESDSLLPGLNDPEKMSAAVYYYIKQQAFDSVYISLEGGLGYFSLLGKETGMHHPRPRMVVIAHAPIAWRSESDRFFLKNLDQLSIAHMEKYCVEQADQVICLSR